MVDIAKQTGGQMIYFRGGAVSHAEIEEALATGVPVTVYTGDGLAPDAVRVAKRLEKNPNYVTDGTEDFSSRPSAGPLASLLTVIIVEGEGRTLQRD